MKKILFMAAMVVMAASCKEGNKPATVKENGLPKAGTKAEAGQTKCPVAYVEIDSLASQYQFCIDQLDALKKKQNGYEARLKKEENTINNLAATIQKNLQEGKYKSESEYKAAMAQGQQKQQQLARHQEQYTQAMAEATAAYQKELRQRLNDFLATYNKDGRFALILTNSEQAINVLYAAPSLDITQDVVNGLNKGYKTDKK